MDVFPHHNKYNDMDIIKNPYFKGESSLGFLMKRARAKYAEADRRAKNMYRVEKRRFYMLLEEKTEIIELLIEMDIALDLHKKYIRSEWEYLTDINYK